jgi:hypothetical protein
MSANAHPLGNVKSPLTNRIPETRLIKVRSLLTRLEVKAEKQQLESLRKAAESELRDICFGPGCDELSWIGGQRKREPHFFSNNRQDATRTHLVVLGRSANSTVHPQDGSGNAGIPSSDRYYWTESFPADGRASRGLGHRRPLAQGYNRHGNCQGNEEAMAECAHYSSFESDRRAWRPSGVDAFVSKAQGREMLFGTIRHLFNLSQS